MCAICMRSPCHPRCPNAPEPPAAFRCRCCDEPILPGEEYGRINGVEYCERCIDNMPLCQLVPLLGGEWKTVQKSEQVICSCCKEHMREGDEYGVLDGAVLCEDCIDEIPYCDLVTRTGHDWNTADREDVYDGYDG